MTEAAFKRRREAKQLNSCFIHSYELIANG